MEEKLEKKQYNGINFMKFICSILVIAIHTNPFNGISKEINFFIVNILSRIAVPLFFICSGYFLYDKLSINDDEFRKYKVLKYISNLIDIYFLWTFIYLIFNFKSYFIDLGYIKGSIIFFRNFIFIGTQFHLWYLIALFTSVFIILYMIKKWKYIFTIILSIGMYLGLLCIGPYYGLIHNNYIKSIIDGCSYILGTPWNSFLMGFPFVVIGISINKYSLYDRVVKPLRIFIITFIGYSIEVIILNKLSISRTSSVSILLLISVSTIFIWLINTENKISSYKLLEKYSDLFRELSLLIYLLHGLFLILFPKLYGALGISNFKNLSIINFILVTMSSILISYYMIKSKSTLIKFIRKPNIINYIFRNDNLVYK